MVFLFLLGSGPFADAGVDWREELEKAPAALWAPLWTLWADRPVPVSTSTAGRSRFTAEPRPDAEADGRAREEAMVMESLLDMAYPRRQLQSSSKTSRGRFRAVPESLLIESSNNCTLGRVGR